MFAGGSFNNFLDALDGSYCDYDGGDNSTFDGIYPDSTYKSKDCGTAPLANVISTSYGYTEALLGPAYIERQCYEYGKVCGGTSGPTLSLTPPTARADGCHVHLLVRRQWRCRQWAVPGRERSGELEWDSVQPWLPGYVPLRDRCRGDTDAAWQNSTSA